MNKLFFISALLAIALPLFPEQVKKNQKLLEVNEGVVADLILSKGESAEHVSIKWKSGDIKVKYYIYRSPLKEGPYEEIGSTGEKSYIDKTAKNGIKYWYRIMAAEKEIPVFISSVEFGYRKISFKGENLDHVIQNKKRNRVMPKDKKIAAEEGRHLEFLKKYLTNHVKLSLIIYAGSSYVKKGDLLLIRNFDSYTLNHEKKEIEFIKKGICSVKFHSSRLFRLIEEAGKAGFGDFLIKQLLGNVMAYSLYIGDIDNKGGDGISLFVPSYEALGISMEYYRDNKEWRGNTIMIGSSNKRLKKMMEEAQQRRQDE